MKNHTDVLIVSQPEQVQVQICAGASQICLMARELVRVTQYLRFASPRRVKRSGMEVYYEHYNSGTRQCNHTFYRYDAGAFCSSSAFDKGRRGSRRQTLYCHVHFYAQHGFALRCKHPVPLSQCKREVPADFPQNRPYDDFCPDCRLLHARMPDCAGRQRRLHPAHRCLEYRHRGYARQSAVD